MPDEEKQSLPRLARAYAINSAAVRTGVPAATTTTHGTIPMSATATSSRGGS
jgi:hypothetical protein